jgi:DHA2 family multidrug resistance protein
VLGHANREGPASVVARISTFSSDAAHAGRLLQAELAQFVTQQALTQAFQDVFVVLAALFAAALLIVPFCKTVILSDEAPSGH